MFFGFMYVKYLKIKLLKELDTCFFIDKEFIEYLEIEDIRGLYSVDNQILILTE